MWIQGINSKAGWNCALNSNEFLRQETSSETVGTLHKNERILFIRGNKINYSVLYLVNDSTEWGWTEPRLLLFCQYLEWILPFEFPFLGGFLYVWQFCDALFWFSLTVGWDSGTLAEFWIIASRDLFTIILSNYASLQKCLLSRFSNNSFLLKITRSGNLWNIYQYLFQSHLNFTNSLSEHFWCSKT